MDTRDVKEPRYSVTLDGLCALAQAKGKVVVYIPTSTGGRCLFEFCPPLKGWGK